MFIDEETETFMKNASLLDSSRRVGLWRIIVAHNVPYPDARRNGKVDSLLFVSNFIVNLLFKFYIIFTIFRTYNIIM